MKKFKLIIIIFLYISSNISAQKNQICLVKYKDLKTTIILGTYNYWFFKDNLIYTKVPNQRAIFLRGFPVLINGIMTTQTDTTKYNQEFNDHINDMAISESKSPKRVSVIYYDSLISKSNYYDDTKNKKYIVVDSLKQLNNWEILNDTMTFMGYLCQKAVINYNQKRYTAWFTTKLPYKSGPGIFNGLPGLILKVINDYGDVGFEAIEIQIPYKGIIPKFENEGELVSHKAWLNIIEERNKRARESLQNMINESKKQAQ